MEQWVPGIARYASATAALAVLASSFFFVLRERRRPTPLSPRLFFLVENPLTGALVGAPLLVGRLDLAPGMKVLDAGCGSGRLTVALAEAVGPGGGVVALDGQPAMLGRLEGKEPCRSGTARTAASPPGTGSAMGSIHRTMPRTPHLAADQSLRTART
jgi:SAM-dependent methyltransferase